MQLLITIVVDMSLNVFLKSFLKMDHPNQQVLHYKASLSIENILYLIITISLR